MMMMTIMMNFSGMIDRRKAFTVVIDPHISEFLKSRQQDLNLRRNWVQAELNKVVQWWHGATMRLVRLHELDLLLL